MSEEAKERGLHLRSIEKVFFRRKAPVLEMKLWLEAFLRGYNKVDCICFHSRLQQLPLHVASPCTRIGTMDEGKGCKFVVRSLREDARQWLRAKGYQLSTSSQQIENDDEFAEEDDSQALDDSNNVSATSLGYTTEEIPASVSTVEGTTRRTGIRAYVLTYIDYYGRDNIEEWLRLWILLRDDSAQFILHLCGCGICKSKSRGGCCNPAHLRIGSRKENEMHKAFHFVIQNTCPENYLQVVDLVVRGNAPEGRGLF